MVLMFAVSVKGASLATKINIIVRISCYFCIYLFHENNCNGSMGGGGRGDVWEFDILVLGLKLAGYDPEEKHGLPNADFHETRTC